MERYHDLQSYPVQRTLSVLLKDRSTGKNIIWATDPPGELAFKYTDRQPITVEQMQSTGFEAVQPRMMKESGAQQERTKKKGEVFTPAWICCLMNNQLDEIWFRRKRRLPCKVTEQSRENLQGPIFFQKGRKWQTYVDSRRLEICCGGSAVSGILINLAYSQNGDLANYVSTTEDNLRSAIKIDDNVYFTVNTSTSNLIVEGNRIPQNKYTLIDGHYLNKFDTPYNSQEIILALFINAYNNLGFVDNPFATEER